MKQELVAPEAMDSGAAGMPGVVGVKWVDSKAEVPVSVQVVKDCAAPGTEREQARWRLLNFMAPTLGNVVMWCGLIGLFFVYWLSCLGRAIKVRKVKRIGWQRMRHLMWQSGLALIFGLGLMGCVGYVGPDGGAVVEGPVVETPGVYVFGGYGHGHYAGAWGHRGAASRGWHR